MKKEVGVSGRFRIFGIVLCVVIDIATTFYYKYKYKVAQQSIFSHLFGELAGFLGWFTFLKDTGSNKWKPLLWCLGSSLYVLMLLFFIEYNLIKSYLSD